MEMSSYSSQRDIDFSDLFCLKPFQLTERITISVWISTLIQKSVNLIKIYKLNLNDK